MEPQATDVVVDTFLELAERLMREHKMAPEAVARIMIGGAVHLFMQHHPDQANAAVECLRQTAGELEALCAHRPPAMLN